MAQEISPPGGKVYDPLLGEKRDAFPGEVVTPEEEKTLTRLMREGKQAFRNQFDPVIATGQLTEEEINSIEKAANIRAELKRREYLDAIRQNPANILQAALKEFNPQENPTINDALLFLNQNISNIIRVVESKRSSDQIREQIRDTISYAGEAIEQGVGGTLTSFVLIDSQSRLRRRLNNSEENILFTLVRDLGFIPLENLESFDNLFRAVKNANNQPSSGMPYIQTDRLREPTLKGLQSKKPGLEGVQAILKYNSSGQLDRIDITASTAGVLARIVDKGQYVPY